MTKEISKVTNAVSIGGESDNLTKGQKALLRLLKERVEQNSPITDFDIRELYMYSRYGSKEGDIIEVTRWLSQYSNNVAQSGYYKVKELHESTRKRLYSEHKQWFRSNLGSCIMKGKLIVLPIIDID